MKIVVVGLGYVGLSNAVLLAQNNQVVGVDISADKINKINANISPIKDDLISEYLTTKRLNLTASSDLCTAVSRAEFVIIATPTDYNEKEGCFDTATIKKLIGQIISYNSKTCIVIRSTLPVGFVDEVRTIYQYDSIMFCPEFLREGQALKDNLNPSRIVIGCKSRKAEIFADLLENGAQESNIKTLHTDSREAEAIKLFSNTYLAMRVAYFNELDSFAMAQGLSSQDIITGVSLDPRIGNYYNNPSFGYGGYCLPKDTKQLLANYQGVPEHLIQAIVSANDARRDFLISELLKKNPKTIGIYKLSMKKNSDNFRSSAIHYIIEKLIKKNINITIYEPLLKKGDMAYLNFTAKIETDREKFISDVDLILANRMPKELSHVRERVFTRDIFGSN